MEQPSLTSNDISVSLRDRVWTQSYGKTKTIQGVRLLDLPLTRDEGGSFVELARINQDGTLKAFPEYTVKQISFSVLEPGVVKAFHLHYAQDDIWFVSPDDRLFVGLLDARAGSVTEGISTRTVLGAGRAQLLFIPRGVAHGAANFSSVRTSVTYFVNNCFNSEDPDERRLPAETLGADFWTLARE